MDVLAEILETIYNNPSKFDAIHHHVIVGIWNDRAEPYDFYAVLEDGRDRDNVICGESSYGSDSIEEALKALLFEMSTQLTNH